MKTILLILFSLNILFAKDIIFATYPSTTPEKLIEAFTPLVKKLSIDLKREVKLVVTKDYNELSDGLKEGSVDMAWMGSNTYVETKKEFPSLVYMATYVERDIAKEIIIPYYNAVILTLKDSPIESLKDLKGRTFAFTDVGSTSGYAYPAMMLRREGINPRKDFDKLFFLKKHDKVIEALVEGSIDAGAVSGGTYDNAVKKYGSIFKIIKTSPPIPLDPIVASPKLDKNIVERAKETLVSIKEHSPETDAIKKALGWDAAGFAIKSDAFYDDIREALEYKE